MSEEAKKMIYPKEFKSKTPVNFLMSIPSAEKTPGFQRGSHDHSAGITPARK